MAWRPLRPCLPPRSMAPPPVMISPHKPPHLPPLHPQSPPDEALADPYFAGLHAPSREPSAAPVCKAAFEFERRKLGTEEVRELIYREILEYHPQVGSSQRAGAAGKFTPRGDGGAGVAWTFARWGGGGEAGRKALS